MGKALIFVFLMVGLTIPFKKVAEWFHDNKSINVIPPALIEVVAVIIFMFTYGSSYTDEIIWMWTSIAIVLVITVFNLIKYGLKDGALASLAELVFGISAAILLILIFVSRGRKSNRKKARYRRK